MGALAQFLDRVFKEARPLAATDALRAAFLQVDTGTYSKIINGKQSLTRSRAARWAKLFYPSEPARQANFISETTNAGLERVRSVQDFCNSIVDNGGSIPAAQISELFKALVEGDVEQKKSLICVEYRDLPRAGEAAKYEVLGDALAEAIADGLNFAMFQPFASEPFDSELTAADSKAASDKMAASDKYVQEMRTKCRETYLRFFRQAVRYAEGKKLADAEEVIRGRLRLYERNSKLGDHTATGFQAKIFLINFKTMTPIRENHYRIIQWVATPKEDLLIYRGEQHIEPEALKDSFFPVPHHFELIDGKLPSLKDDVEMDAALSAIIGARTTKVLPEQHKMWKSFE